MSNTPPENWLPRLIDPRKFAQQELNLSGQIAINELTRLCSFLVKPVGEVQVDLSFSINEQGHRCLNGYAHADFFMACQRCLEESKQFIVINLNLVMLWSDEQAASLSKEYDPWIVGEGHTDIYQVIEDELILGLPLVAYHDYECVESSLMSSGDDMLVNADSTEVNPFQVLEGLKDSLKSVSSKSEN